MSRSPYSIYGFFPSQRRSATIQPMPRAKRGSMKQKCSKCGASVDTAKALPLSPVPCPKCGKKLRAERSFDHYVLLETLGLGGIGAVYKAHDTVQDRLVALK